MAENMHIEDAVRSVGKARKPRQDKRNDAYFNMRLSKAERQKLKAAAKKAGMASMSDYVRAIINADNGHDTIQLIQLNVDEKLLNDLLHELKKSGTNLNQIAYKLNSRGDIDLSEFDSAVRRHKRAASAVADFIEELRPSRLSTPSATKTEQSVEAKPQPQDTKPLKFKINLQKDGAK